MFITLLAAPFYGWRLITEILEHCVLAEVKRRKIRFIFVEDETEHQQLCLLTII